MQNYSQGIRKPVLDVAILFEDNWINQERYLFRLNETERANDEFTAFLQQDCDAIYGRALEYGFKEIEYNRGPVYEEFFELHNRICEVEIQGKKMAEILAFEGISLLQYIPERCYDDYPREIILLIEYISGLIERHAPGKVRVMGHLNKSHYAVLTQISGKYQIAVEYYELRGKGSRASCPQSLDSLRPWSSVVGRINRRLENGAYARSLKSDTGGIDKVLMLSLPRLLGRRPDGQYYDDMYDAFKQFCVENRLCPVRIEVPYYYQAEGGIKKYTELVKTGRPGGFDGALLDEFLDESMLAEIERLRNELDIKFFDYTKQPEFLKVFSWKGVSIFEPLKAFWYGLLVNHLSCECALSLLAARKMMQALKPSAVFAVYEVGCYARSVIIEAHRAGVPSFALQHATMNDQVSYYRLRNLNHKPDLSKPCLDMIIPSTTLVFGTEYKKFLTSRGHYSADAVEVVGIDWRLLNTQKDSNKHTPAKLKTEWFGDKKVAVLLSGLSTIDALNHLVIKLSPADWAVLIKLHPEDPNTDLYTKTLNEKGFHSYITKDYLYESLDMADIVFAAASSTTILDALYRGKPTFYYENIPWPYSEPWKKLAVDMYSVAQYETYSVSSEKEKQIRDYLVSIGYRKDADHAVFTGILNKAIGKYIRQNSQSGLNIPNEIAAVSNPVLKKKEETVKVLCETRKEKLPTKIDPDAKIINSKLTGDIAIGEGCLIENAFLLGIGSILVGKYSTINGPNTDLYSLHNPIRIGNFCSIARNVSVQEYEHITNRCTSYFILNHVFGEDWKKETVSRGSIDIGSDVWIGTQTVILSGSKIGHGAVIGANSVVKGEIPPYAIAAGSPAKVIKYRFEKNIIDKLLEMKWWDWPVEKIRNNRQLFEGELTMEKLNHIKSPVSVIIPAYNRQNMIVRAIESVLNQTCPVNEIIVVDDHSADKTVEVVRELMIHDKRIKLLCHQTNRGAQAARNTGIKAATGEWIAFLDSDDEWLPEKMERQLAAAHQYNVSVVHGQFLRSKNGKLELQKAPAYSGNIFRDILTKPGIGFPSLLVRKNCLLKIGCLDETITSWQEWDTVIRLAEHYEFGFVPEPVFIWHLHDEETISKDNHREAIGYYQIIEKHREKIVQCVGVKALLWHYMELMKKFEKLNDYAGFQEIKRKADSCLVLLKQGQVLNMNTPSNSGPQCQWAAGEKQKTQSSVPGVIELKNQVPGSLQNTNKADHKTSQPVVYKYEKKGYISAKDTVNAARSRGMSVMDYVENLWDQKGQTRKVVDTISEITDHHKFNSICEIGPGTGRYMELFINRYNPASYHFYETARDWENYLTENYDDKVQPKTADGKSLSETPSDSCDMVIAHGVFVYLSFMNSFEYFKDMVRVCKRNGFIVFDIYSDEDFDTDTINTWIGAEANYPVVLPQRNVIRFFEKDGVTLINSFRNKYGHSFSRYLVFKKTVDIHADRHNGTVPSEFHVGTNSMHGLPAISAGNVV